MWTDRDRDKALAYRDYQRTVCSQCGTRYDDWDHGFPGQEDAYVAVYQRCVGCQVISEKQDGLKDDSDRHGKKIALIPASLHAAQQAARELKTAARRRDLDDD